jgi:hypothetical protein
LRYIFTFIPQKPDARRRSLGLVDCQQNTTIGSELIRKRFA